MDLVWCSLRTTTTTVTASFKTIKDCCESRTQLLAFASRGDCSLRSRSLWCESTMPWCTGAASSCEMYDQLASCDPCELQGLRQCYHLLPITLSVFGSLQERVRCDFLPLFLQPTSDDKFHVDVVLVADDAWCVSMFAGTDAVLFGAVWKMRHDGISSLFFTTRPRQTRALCVRDSVAILWLERASLSRVLCQTSDRECLSLLSAVERDSAHFSRLFVSSLLAALFEGQWSALPTSAHSNWTLYAESREQVLVVVHVRTIHLAQL